VERAAADGLEKKIDLKLGVEPAFFQAWPRAPRQRGRGGILGVVLRKTQRRAVERLVVEPRLNALHRLLEIRFSL